MTGKNIEMSRDSIKMLAMVTMLLNHIAAVFLEKGSVLYTLLTDIGYFTAITMCYFLVEGYGYTRSKKKYGCRLLAMAVISQIPYSMAFFEKGEEANLNMMFTLFICFLIIYAAKELPGRQTSAICAGLGFMTGFCDWPIFAAVFTFLFLWAGEDETRKRKAFFWSALSFGCYIFLDRFSWMKQSGEAFSLFFLLGEALGAAAAPAFAGILITRVYNGRRAQSHQLLLQWFFYLFYPVHLLLLVLVRRLW